MVMKNVVKIIVAILVIVIAWKLLKGLIGLAIGVAVGRPADLRRHEADRGAEAHQMTIVAILVAVVLAFLAFRFVTGLIKFGVLALIVLAVLFFLAKGGGVRMTSTGPLGDKDRIFTNLYGFQSPDLKAAQDARRLGRHRKPDGIGPGRRSSRSSRHRGCAAAAAPASRPA